MTTSEQEWITFARQLPPEVRDEVRTFAEFLLVRRLHHKEQSSDERTSFLHQQWAGALNGFSDLSAVELQHQVAEWINESVAKSRDHDLPS